MWLYRMCLEIVVGDSHKERAIDFNRTLWLSPSALCILRCLKRSKDRDRDCDRDLHKRTLQTLLFAKDW
jgi:hypothetical protein